MPLDLVICLKMQLIMMPGRQSLERKISELNQKIEEAVIIKASKNINKVQIGSIVFVESGKNELSFKIVDSEEVDISQGKISYDSPLGKTLLIKVRDQWFKLILRPAKLNIKLLK